MSTPDAAVPPGISRHTEPGPAPVIPRQPGPAPVIPRQRAKPEPRDRPQAGPPAAGTRRPGSAPSRIAFTVWAFAFAVGILVHEWQAVEPPWSIHTVAGIVAIFALLRPRAPWLTIALLAVLAVEFLLQVPSPYPSAVLVYLVAPVAVLWWAVLRIREPDAAADPGVIYERLAPFLRVSFLMTWLFGALARLNPDFLTTLASCAPVLVDEIDMLPRVPTALYPAAVVAAVTLQIAIPTLLLIRRTRVAGVALGLAFYAVVVVGGEPATGAVAVSFLLLFLPTGTLARAAVVARSTVFRVGLRRLSAAARHPLVSVGLVVLWVAALSIEELTWISISGRTSRWSAILLCLLWILLWARALLAVRRERAQHRSSALPFTVRGPLLIGGLGLILFNAACPYLGLKTHFSFVQYSNLRTEAGYWNHLLVPQAVRVFDLQDHTLRFLEAEGDPGFVEVIEYNEETSWVLVDAQRLTARFPTSTVSYEMDGRTVLAAPIADDPLLNEAPSPVVRWFAGFRNLPIDNQCRA